MWRKKVHVDELNAEILMQKGQELEIFLVTKEDVYETTLGDGYYGHLSAAFWLRKDAEKYAKSRRDIHKPGAETTGYLYHVEAHRLAIDDGQPRLITPTKPHDNTITVAGICELLR